MRYAALILLLACMAIPFSGQEKATIPGPTDEKAQKTYREGLELLKERKTLYALESFKKADKQDGGHCQSCQRKMLEYGTLLHDWKTAEIAAEELVTEAQGNDVALAHYEF